MSHATSALQATGKHEMQVGYRNLGQLVISLEDQRSDQIHRDVCVVLLCVFPLRACLPEFEQ